MASTQEKYWQFVKILPGEYLLLLPWWTCDHHNIILVSSEMDRLFYICYWHDWNLYKLVMTGMLFILQNHKLLLEETAYHTARKVLHLCVKYVGLSIIYVYGRLSYFAFINQNGGQTNEMLLYQFKFSTPDVMSIL